ncbi:MAG: UDP-N-acetylmuramoyl-tripeptide--D-alanyl-D-alanine ligase [Candidatus Portnoybacteria bacterium]|nr:UDP-N-acetylmuramoyl-tripeptide--D-alanyl-D-alanine ligase [Candidatus Portnoybacteria bacterium]MDD4983049.1 UDP-N-acetylmuramoyl-tripeptide--D-alanyl-D-alanine ligase [Candidatus Portnoybacteria bacterium]
MPKKILCFILKILARATLWRYKPLVIGVTGSVGKTAAKEAIYAVLKEKFGVRRNIKNYNNEIGAPLTILGQISCGDSVWRWLQTLLIGFFEILYAKNYPKILVLEMGADKMGDIAYLTDFIKCHVGVITAIGEIPVHVEFFQGADQVAKEKANLVRGLDKGGWAVLNYDDQRVRAMARKTPAQIFTYGFDEKADLRASNFEQRLDDLSDVGMSFKVDYQGSNVPVRLSGLCAQHQVYAVLAGMAVGLIFKLNLVEIAQALKSITPYPGRLRLLRGIKKTWIIDDTYNSSPSSSLKALELLGRMSNLRTDGEPGRKIAALGDMLELGAFSEEAHRKIGANVAKAADILLAVGEKSIFMADEAKKNGLAQERAWYFADSEDAGRELQDMIKEGDIILVKGSQGMRMEKIVKELMAEPERAKELLVRQGEEWESR